MQQEEMNEQDNLDDPFEPQDERNAPGEAPVLFQTNCNYYNKKG